MLSIYCINPFIYAATYGEFQKGVRRMVDCFARSLHQIQPQQNNRSDQVMSNPANQQTPITGDTT